MRIAVMSDTHGLLRPEAIEIVKSCDVILHGGDIDTPEILEKLSAYAQLYVVRGNNDGEWAESLPLSLHFALDGIRFFMVHDKNDIPKDLSATDVVVFGHSHQYYEEIKNGCLWLNPGSCGKRRFRLGVTMAVLEIEDKRLDVQRIELIPASPSKNKT